MDTADVMEALINRPSQWVRLKVGGAPLAEIASGLNRMDGFEVLTFGTDVIARWTPASAELPTLADVPVPEKPPPAPGSRQSVGAFEARLAAQAADLAPPTFEPSASQRAAREAFKRPK